MASLNAPESAQPKVHPVPLFSCGLKGDTVSRRPPTCRPHVVPITGDARFRHVPSFAL